MSFERKSLQGPRGVVIQGPEEHVGESRYHWLEKVGGLKPRMEMLLRIEKSYSTADHDLHSPIVSLRFEPGGLFIRLGNSQKLQHEGLRAFLNPYRNALARNAPSFLIRTEHWIENRCYYLRYKTNPWGDFLIFETQPCGKEDTKKRRHQVLLLNLWAIFGLAGLHQIHSNGTMCWMDKKLGQIPTKNGGCLPFFADLPMPIDFFAVARIINDFQKRSAERAFMMFRRKDKISSVCDADVFDVIGECTYGDRPSNTPESGLEWAKREFVKLFPEAV
ncbi:MAG: hypothetical protein Q7K26_02290 [bacterium]|nr:hypothetical protein [bacterium]